MVCQKCEKKLSALATPDPFKKKGSAGGAAKGRAAAGGAGGAQRASLGKGKHRSDKHSPVARYCKICKVGVGEKQHYCQGCSYSKGICSMCGRRIAKTSESSVHPCCLQLCA